MATALPLGVTKAAALSLNTTTADSWDNIAKDISVDVDGGTRVAEGSNSYLELSKDKSSILFYAVK